MFLWVTAAAALAAAVGVWAVIRRERRLLRALARERVARTADRLMAARVYQDLDVFRARVGELVAGREVLREADRVLDLALAGTGATGMDPNSKSTEGEAS